MLTNKASTNEITNLEEVLNSAHLPKRIAAKAEKRISISKECRLTQKEKEEYSEKSQENKPLTERQKKFNK